MPMTAVVAAAGETSGGVSADAIAGMMQKQYPQRMNAAAAVVD